MSRSKRATSPANGELVQGCIDAVELAFKDTERLKSLRDRKERRLVAISFKDGLPVATQANAEAQSFLLRELIQAGALETKAISPIREGFMALDRLNGYKLSHRKSTKGKKRWASDEAEAARLLLTYVKACNTRGPGRSPSKVIAKLKLLIEARPKPKTLPMSPESSSDEDSSSDPTSTDSCEIIENPKNNPPPQAVAFPTLEEQNAKAGQHVPRRQLTKVISIDSPDQSTQNRCPEVQPRPDPVNVDMPNVFDSTEHRKIMKRPVAAVKRPAADLEEDDEDRSMPRCGRGRAQRTMWSPFANLQRLRELRSPEILPRSDVAAGASQELPRHSSWKQKLPGYSSWRQELPEYSSWEQNLPGYKSWRRASRV